MTQNNSGEKEKGALRSDQNQLINEQGFSFSGYERDALYMNIGGKKFKDVSGVSGIDSITDGRAAVFADFDNDGDYDVFLTTIQGPAHLLFRNNVGQQNNFLRISLEGGKDLGRDAYGAIVRIKTSQGTLTKIKSGGSGFISQHDPRLLFGLGGDEHAQAIEVTWPNGKVEQFEASAAQANASLLLREGTGRPQLLNIKRALLPNPLTRTEAFARNLKINVGSTLPEISVRATNGMTMPLRTLLRRGRRTLINVWATWCSPCAREMPELERLRTRLAAHGVDLVGLNVDSEPNANVKGFIAEKNVHYPIYIGGVAAIEKLYATDELAVPLSLVVDEKGTVIELIPGWSSSTQRRFAALAGGSDETMAPAEAQPNRKRP